MPEFDLAKPYKAEYRFARLPNIGPHCGVHLAIRDQNDRLMRERDKKQFDGKVQLDLLNSQDRQVVSVSGRLGDYIWWGFSDLHVLYQLNDSFFYPDTAQEYQLRFSYEPDSRLEGYKGFVYIQSGGHK